MKFLEKIQNFCSSKNTKIVNFYSRLKQETYMSYVKAKNGDEDMSVILIYWSVIPIIFYFLIRHKVILKGFFALLMDIAFFILFLLDYYFIAKTVEKHPELDVSKTKELEKMKYYETLTEEQLKEEKKKETKAKVGNIFKRYVFLSNQDTVEPFKVVRTLLLLFILISLKRIIF